MDIERDKGTVGANEKALIELTCADCWYCTWSDLWTSACIKFELPIKADGPACISINPRNNPPGNPGMSN